MKNSMRMGLIAAMSMLLPMAASAAESEEALPVLDFAEIVRAAVSYGEHIDANSK